MRGVRAKCCAIARPLTRPRLRRGHPLPAGGARGAPGRLARFGRHRRFPARAVSLIEALRRHVRSHRSGPERQAGSPFPRERGEGARRADEGVHAMSCAIARPLTRPRLRRGHPLPVNGARGALGQHARFKRHRRSPATAGCLIEALRRHVRSHRSGPERLAVSPSPRERGEGARRADEGRARHVLRHRKAPHPTPPAAGPPSPRRRGEGRARSALRAWDVLTLCAADPLVPGRRDARWRPSKPPAETKNPRRAGVSKLGPVRRGRVR
jgi:hypothetical protein